MLMTATQKIIASHAGHDVKAGDLVTVDVDLVLGNDITSPVAIEEVKKSGKKISIPEKVVLVMDHFVPCKDIKSAEQCKICREFAKANGIKNFFDAGDMGIEHALLPEKGFAKPGMLIIGADSHTCTYGALSCLSTGIGSTDMAAAMITGKMWLRVPEAIKVVIKGKLNKYVTGKDVILTIIKELGTDGATYKSLEFFGDISSLSIDDRLCIANMAIECGAKNAFFPVDNITKDYLKEVGANNYSVVEPDKDAVYCKKIVIDLSTLSPVAAFPSLPSNVKSVEDLQEKIVLDQVVIGSCTNGRMEDLRVARDILKGKKVNKNVRCIVLPGTQKIYLQAIAEGIVQDLVEAGCAVSTPTCGPCLGGHMGILAAGERCVSTTNRNFVGRMGHVDSEVYLASPATAAASAIAGYIADPRDYMEER